MQQSSFLRALTEASIFGCQDAIRLYIAQKLLVALSLHH